jgi:gamma-glutamyltranspeptidase/glutathione hydrolase
MQGIHLDLLQRYPTTAKLFLRDGKYPYRPYSIDAADIHQQPELARLLDEIGLAGPDAFYKGRAADLLAKEMKSGGGLIDKEDFENYRIRKAAPYLIKYRGYSIAGVPWTIAFYAEFLRLLSEFDLSKFTSPADPERLHLLAEIFKRCWQDRGAYGGDPDFVEAPWEGLRSTDYARAVSKHFDASKVGLALADVDPADFDDSGQHSRPLTRGLARESNTVHISAADGDGGMASLTETILGNYGSLVSIETGVLLNNGMMAFAPVDGHPNRILPGKRPSTNMGPLVVHNAANKPFMTLGASGGRKIVSAVLQILSFVIDHRMDLQQAIAEPRMDVVGDTIYLDGRIPRAVADALTQKGHKVEFRQESVATFEFGNPCGILCRDGVLFSGVNPFQMTAGVAV